MPEHSTNVLKHTQDEEAGRNRRQELRLPCDPGTVLLESAAHPEPVEGQIVEVSKSGLQLRLGTLVPAGDAVRITRASVVISGQIRYCRPNESGSFDTGVTILDIQQM